VNNGTSDPQPSRARKTEFQPNKLLEANDGKQLDFGAATQAVGANPHVEAVGKVDRAKIA